MITMKNVTLSVIATESRNYYSCHLVPYDDQAQGPVPGMGRGSVPTARCRARTLLSAIWMMMNMMVIDHDDDGCEKHDGHLDHDGDNLSRWHQTVAVPQLETSQWCLKVTTMSEYTLWMII